MDGIETFLVDEESLSDEGGIIWWVSSLSPRVWIADNILKAVADGWLVCPYVHLPIRSSIHPFEFVI